MPSESSEITDVRLKVNVLVLLIGTLIQTAKTGIYLSREDWIVTINRVHQLLALV
jgi:hypothetical protein